MFRWSTNPVRKVRLHRSSNSSQAVEIALVSALIMLNEIPISELRSFFRNIESGDIRLVAELDPQDVYAGNVVYRASNGWILRIFNDANEFDYVDEVRSSDGRVTDFDAIEGTEAEWRPDDETAWKCLGIPGYCIFRCTGCGALLPDGIARGRPVEPPFLCGEDHCADQCSPPMGTWIRVRCSNRNMPT